MSEAGIHRGDKFEIEVCFFKRMRVIGKVEDVSQSSGLVSLSLGDPERLIERRRADLKIRLAPDAPEGVITYPGDAEDEVRSRYAAFGIKGRKT